MNTELFNNFLFGIIGTGATFGLAFSSERIKEIIKYSEFPIITVSEFSLLGTLVGISGVFLGHLHNNPDILNSQTIIPTMLGATLTAITGTYLARRNTKQK